MHPLELTVVSCVAFHHSIALAEGIYAGTGQNDLVLHGNPVRIHSDVGAERTIIDCTVRDSVWGTLFARGESELVTISDVTLRRALLHRPPPPHDALRPPLFVIACCHVHVRVSLSLPSLP